MPGTKHKPKSAELKAARAKALEYLGHHVEHGWIPGPVAPISIFRSKHGAMGASLYDLYCATDPSKLMELAEMAEAGDAEADYALRMCLALDAEGGALSPIKVKLLHRCLHTAPVEPRRKRGKDPQRFADRDVIILQAVKLVRGLGFVPTRNRESLEATISACLIVSKALGKLGINMSEPAVERVWNHVKDRDPFVRR